MDNLYRFHHNPPKGWLPTHDGAFRDVSPTVTLRVSVVRPGQLRGLINGSSVGLYRSLNEAIAAVERAWCNCGIKEVKRG